MYNTTSINIYARPNKGRAIVEYFFYIRSMKFNKRGYGQQKRRLKEKAGIFFLVWGLIVFAFQVTKFIFLAPFKILGWIISLFKKKSPVVESNPSSKVKMTAEVDEVKEGYFEATIILPKGTEISDLVLESLKRQVRKSMEADGEEVIDVSIKILNAKKRSRTITQAVKDRVWNRDGGKCVQCGSNENLEFDHIIPFSKGGANTYRNIQLLCEPCNRSKSAKIG